MPVRTGDRASVSFWSAARARNALRHRRLMAAVALGCAVVALFVLPVVPREAQRALDSRIARLPPIVDTAALQARRTAVADTLRVRDAQLVARRDQRRTDSLFAVTVVGPSGASRVVVGDTLRADLAERLRVARSSRLVESFLALAAAPALRDEPAVNTLADSLATLERSLAAFGSGDAQRATLRAQVNALGDQLVARVDMRLQVARDAAGAGAGESDLDSLSLALQGQVRLLRDTAGALETALRRARTWNQLRDTRVRTWRAESAVRAPRLPVAVATVLVSASLGFLAAFVVELRRPRLADAGEVRQFVRLAGLSPTLVIQRDPRVRVPRRRAADRLLPEALLGDPSAYQQVHHLLTTMGDAVTFVGVRSSSARDTAAVALNLASSAADASRAALLVDGDVIRRQVATVAEQPDRPGIAEVARERFELASVLTTVPTGRDRSVTLLAAGRTRTAREMIEHVAPDIQRLMQRFDLCVFAMPIALNMWPTSLQPADQVIAVRLGVTDVAWLHAALNAAARDGQRVRAILVSGELLS